MTQSNLYLACINNKTRSRPGSIPLLMVLPLARCYWMQQRAWFTRPIWTPSCCFILDKIACKLCHNPTFGSKILITITNWNSWGSNKGNFIEIAHTRLLWRSRSWLSPVLSPPKHQIVVSFDGIHLNLLKIWDSPIVAYTGHSYNTMCIIWWR